MSGFMQNQPADAIAPLMALNSKLQGDSRHYLTAVHSTILYAALRSSQFGQVVPLLLDQPVTDVDMRVSRTIALNRQNILKSSSVLPHWVSGQSQVSFVWRSHSCHDLRL